MADIMVAPQRRQKLLVFAFTAVVLVAVATAQSVDLWWRRTQALEAAEKRAANLAFILSEYIRGTIAVTDTALRQLTIHGRRVGGSRAPAEAWDPILSAARLAMPGSGSITITDAEGTVRRSTQPAIVGHSRRDNYIFQQLAAVDRDVLAVGTPFLTPFTPKRYVIPIGRRLVGKDGEFDGTVVATLMPESYRPYFRTVDVGGAGTIWVLHSAGFVLVREPSDRDPTGEPATDHPVLSAALASRGDGVLKGPLEAGGPRYVTGYRSVGTPALIVAVSLSEAGVLADWRHQRGMSALAFAALTLTLAGMLSVLFRQMSKREAAEHELREIQRQEAERLREANERLAEALEREQKARQEVEAASYLKDEFLMTVSHELRTPLTAIYGWVRMLSSDAVRPEERTRALSAIERNARSQARLIDDLLDVSRAISGKLRIDARPVDVAEVVRAAIDTLQPALQAKNLAFDRRIEENLEPVMGDSDRLQQIVWNLLSNAIKFTPDGGRVSVAVTREGSSIQIVVSDSGAGMPPEFLPHVFERFRQADAGTRRQFGGLGLGLAIVRHLTELHGGTVSAESAGRGRGSTFRVHIPVRPGSVLPADRVDGAVPDAAGGAR